MKNLKKINKTDHFICNGVTVIPFTNNKNKFFNKYIIFNLYIYNNVK
jgi:hypothetical protein